MTHVTEEEWRSFVKISALLGRRAVDIHMDLTQVMADAAPHDSTVRRWTERFLAGQETVVDNPRSGRERTLRTEKTIAEVRNAIEEDPRATMDYVAQVAGISHGTAQKILSEDLQMRKVFAKWVPHDLTASQKRERLETCQYLKKRLTTLGKEGRKNIVTGDETYFYLDMPESRRSASAWVKKGSPAPKIVKPSMGSKKACYALFFSAEGVIAQVPTPKGATVTGSFYAGTVLPTVLKNFTDKRGKATMLLHHDNAAAHRSGIVHEFIEQSAIRLLPHPPYSPDISPCDFWLNAFVKEQLAGKSYTSRSALGSGLHQCLKVIPQERFERCFEQWQERMQLCIDAEGNYFE
jgi:histone-lysine N-methyltransferase SETMAR